MQILVKVNKRYSKGFYIFRSWTKFDCGININTPKMDTLYMLTADKVKMISQVIYDVYFRN